MPASAAAYACLRSCESRANGMSVPTAANAAAPRMLVASRMSITAAIVKPCSAER